MPDKIDPDEPISLDLGDEDPEDALRRLLAGAGTEQPVSTEASEALYGPDGEEQMSEDEEQSEA